MAPPIDWAWSVLAPRLLPASWLSDGHADLEEAARRDKAEEDEALYGARSGGLEARLRRLFDYRRCVTIALERGATSGH